MIYVSKSCFVRSSICEDIHEWFERVIFCTENLFQCWKKFSSDNYPLKVDRYFVSRRYLPEVIFEGGGIEDPCQKTFSRRMNSYMPLPKHVFGIFLASLLASHQLTGTRMTGLKEWFPKQSFMQSTWLQV